MTTYNFIATNGMAYDLPKATLGMMEKLDDVMRVDTLNIPLKQRYQRCLNFLIDVLTADTVKAILGSDKLNDIDVNELVVNVEDIYTAYRAPVDAKNRERITNALESINADKITAISDVISTAKR